MAYVTIRLSRVKLLISLVLTKCEFRNILIDIPKFAFCQHQTNQKFDSAQSNRLIQTDYMTFFTNLKSNLKKVKKENEENMESDLCKQHTLLNFISK